MMILRMTLVYLTALWLLVGCSGSGNNSQSDPDPNPNPKNSPSDVTAVADPENESLLHGTSTIVIRFDQAMDPQSLVLGGTLGQQSDGGAWSENEKPNDTLVLNPATRWRDGVGQELVIDANDAEGNAMESLSLRFDVDAVAPTYVVPDSFIIGKTQVLTFAFSELIDIESLQLKGSMAAEISDTDWSVSADNKSILSISPVGQWSVTSHGFAFEVTDVAGNLLQSEDMLWTVDDQIPTADVSVSNGAAMTASQMITIKFSETIVPSSVTASGSLFEQSKGIQVTTTDLVDDTVIIEPEVAWSSGDHQLTLDATDVAGLPVATVSLAVTADVLFVSPSGDDAFDGSRGSPLKTLNHALTRAADDQYGTLYIQIHDEGYSEAVVVDRPMHFMGGFDQNWNQSNTRSLIVAPDGERYGLRIMATQDVRLENLELKGQASGLPRSPSVAAWVEDTQNVVMHNVYLVSSDAGNGVGGFDGGNASLTPPAKAENGGDAGNLAFGTVCDDVSRGSGGTNNASGRRQGGNGGDGGKTDLSCSSESTRATSGLDGDDAPVSSPPVYGGGGPGGRPCQPGEPGVDGTTVHGQGGTKTPYELTLTTSITGYQLRVTSGTGELGEPGSVGTGGGGGGGSGGCDVLRLSDSYGAGGGAGGTGGSPGGRGLGGSHGGYSIGLVVVNSQVEILDSQVVAGNGGDGGIGGAPGLGQPGGEGGDGGRGIDRKSGPGGKGGRGGDGGNGGAGAGGAGGPSYGIWMNENADVSLLSTTVSHGAVGSGGIGRIGTPRSVSSEDGDDGEAMDVKNLGGAFSITP